MYGADRLVRAVVTALPYHFSRFVTFSGGVRPRWSETSEIHSYSRIGGGGQFRHCPVGDDLSFFHDHHAVGEAGGGEQGGGNGGALDLARGVLPRKKVHSIGRIVSGGAGLPNGPGAVPLLQPAELCGDGALGCEGIDTVLGDVAHAAVDQDLPMVRADSGRRPVRARAIIVFPAPGPPSRAVICPAGTFRSTFVSTVSRQRPVSMSTVRERSSAAMAPVSSHDRSEVPAYGTPARQRALLSPAKRRPPPMSARCSVLLRPGASGLSCPPFPPPGPVPRPCGADRTVSR